MHWLEVQQNKEQYLRYLMFADRLRAESFRASHLHRLNFAFLLMSVYQLYPERVEEIDRGWMYYRGHLITSL
jgi:hypothetical protein